MFFADFKAGYDERLFLLSDSELAGVPHSDTAVTLLTLTAD